MYKLRSIRQTLMSELGLEPDKLITYVADGYIVATAASKGGFEYHYKLQIVLMDYAGDSDLAVVAVLDWLREHQPEMLLSRDLIADGFKFEVDILNHETYDLGITLKLSERVSVVDEGGRRKITHHPEPPLDPYVKAEHWTLEVQGKQVAEWRGVGE